MEDCLFCKIVQREISALVVYEDEHALAFLDLHPRAAGHTVVIPKIHASSIALLPEGEVGPVFAAVRRVDQMIIDRLAPDGISLGINQGAASGQEVDHLHIHLMPRRKGDGGGSVQSIVDAPQEDSREAILKKMTE